VSCTVDARWRYHNLAGTESLQPSLPSKDFLAMIARPPYPIPSEIGVMSPQGMATCLPQTAFLLKRIYNLGRGNFLGHYNLLGEKRRGGEGGGGGGENGNI